MQIVNKHTGIEALDAGGVSTDIIVDEVSTRERSALDDKLHKIIKTLKMTVWCCIDNQS